MEKAKIMPLILILVLIACLGTRQINADGLCCKDHSAVGECIPGVDDSPETPGKCFSFCLDGCLNGKGGVCKPVGKGHICHCCCDYERCH
ncbi:hypothetical protein Tsubulata_038803 [Turnera subulata]|uniref:Knottin scorpion toxin-like domain-containing protein n=1 Tax=Turnera subulata TaxID=218843 RepID=A0A9Q0JAW4_9ROSI|nr:hypothetical protein Tsubulata_038803 [Turnera subulata]